MWQCIKIDGPSLLSIQQWVLDDALLSWVTTSVCAPWLLVFFFWQNLWCTIIFSADPSCEEWWWWVCHQGFPSDVRVLKWWWMGVADRNECNAHRIGGDFWVGWRVAVSWNQQSAWKIEQRESYNEANRKQTTSIQLLGVDSTMLSRIIWSGSDFAG
jgi:hypothetical protein